MIILAIETSGETASVAVCDEAGALAVHRFGKGARHARNVMPAIDDVIRRAGLSKQRVDAVAVSAGPGSFTGLRVGITCAKTLAWALGWRAVAVPSLEVLVRNVDPAVHGGCRHVCPIFDARRRKVYATLFEWDEARWADKTGVLLTEPRELAERLTAGTLVFGTGVRAYPEVLSEGKFTVGEPELEAARAEAAAQLGLELLGECKDVDPMALVPQYYRLTEPEEKLLAGSLPIQEEE
jgi:tRNA threonylcarbamoyladenosine biosynthesis protein TsaB